MLSLCQFWLDYKHWSLLRSLPETSIKRLFAEYCRLDSGIAGVHDVPGSPFLWKIFDNYGPRHFLFFGK